MHFGNHILAIKFEMEDIKDELVTVMLATFYAPVGNAKDHIRRAFSEDMKHLIEAPKSNGVLLVCIDANVSMGTRSYLQGRVLGHFGKHRVNSASRELHDLFDSKSLCSTATFFAKPAYGTWRHPRSKDRFQLDHVLIPRDDLSRVRDASIYNQGTVESDHAPLQIKLRIARNLSKQSGSKGTFTKRELLRIPAIARNFRQVVLAHLVIESPPSLSPSPSQAIFQDIVKTEACRVDIQMHLLLRALQLGILKAPPLEQLQQRMRLRRSEKTREILLRPSHGK